MNDYAAKILADSLSPDGVRLTTFEITFPRFILAELNTHRVLSRNSASSRAIPTEKLLERVRTSPFIPNFNKRVKGMGVGAALEGDEAKCAVDYWKTARNNAVEMVEKLHSLDVDKSRVNRLLEPFMWHTAIVTATEWSNFFSLRNNPEAQPEFTVIAAMMQTLLDNEEPRLFASHDEWHMPLVSDDEFHNSLTPPDCFDSWDEAYASYEKAVEWWKKVSVGRCARVSYLTHDGKRDPYADVELADRLKTSGHMSPFEHVARPLHWSDIPMWELPEKFGAQPTNVAEQFIGNFRGWWQFRKDIPNEADFGLVMKEQA